jgi:hypothetical protein
MRLPKLTGVDTRRGHDAQAPRMPAARLLGIEASYSGACCRRDAATGKFLDCCYGPCRVVNSC